MRSSRGEAGSSQDWEPFERYVGLCNEERGTILAEIRFPVVDRA